MNNRHIEFLQCLLIKRDDEIKVRQRKRYLFTIGKRRCHYCGNALQLSGVPSDKDYATLEHLYSRMDIRRPLSDFHKDTVICCYSCNVKRNEKELRSIYSEFNYNVKALTIDTRSKSIILSPEIFKTA